ncbi:DNA topoisomerase IB [Maritimibacter dapengensis]|uniref:DNA topoisomerase IB n=1 Tax=Maritimibacter dapengensis TaxID=2836868 RepID=A0ABS6T4M6_9RHOB|nr:DNA topoisomerase IB [Maritimibacter dapengensis]MBV7380099.1 DNA topoisomerase IB [Maritimibacter dapengensis]
MIDGLIYYPDSRPGISRHRHGRGFTYRGPDGTTIARGPERKRLEAMAVPPAYERVWMSPRKNGHLLATGYDARERKQYRYHPEWTEARSRTKFDDLASFGRCLPAIRRRVARDLADDAGERDFALAACVALVDKLAIRVGDKSYATENGSYGATTLQRRHVRATKDGISLSFTAKGGQKVREKVDDKRLMKALEACRDLPGADLLTWLDDDGVAHGVSSHALNAYLSEASMCDGVTAKTFRTWAGTLAAFRLVEAGEANTIKSMSEAAAERLNNTVTVARNSYIHPDVIDLAGVEAPKLPKPARLPGLVAGEGALLAFLER